MLEETVDARRIKRPRVEVATHEVEDSHDHDACVRRHPLGVRPAGNVFAATADLKTSAGWFASLPDELLSHLLEHLDAPRLLGLGATCRALHAFTRNEELWRSLFVESNLDSSFSWRGTWRSTFLSQPTSKEPDVDCSNLFSDVLHRPFLCAHVPFAPFSQAIPKANEIPRLDILSSDEFQARWVNEPFVLTSPVKQWPIYQTWSIERLLEKYSEVAFRAESVDWRLGTYVEYMKASSDESPLYLFDRSFAEKMDLTITPQPSEEADYWPPNCFGFDAFSVLLHQRPDHRWLIVGPARSGSTFHKDPNATSAWNAVIKGSKYWIMFRSSPSIPPPPGVFVSADQSEVTSPLSIAEWLLGFHAEARRTPGCKEGICGEGEVLYVPSGWYHLVLNLESSIAVTQNFVPQARIGAVLQFLRDQKPSISGFSDSVTDQYSLFVERLREHDPQMLERGLADLDRLSKGAKGKWEELTKTGALGEGSREFSFGFGGGDDDEEVP